MNIRFLGPGDEALVQRMLESGSAIDIRQASKRIAEVCRYARTRIYTTDEEGVVAVVSNANHFVTLGPLRCCFARMRSPTGVYRQLVIDIPDNSDPHCLPPPVIAGVIGTLFGFSGVPGEDYRGGLITCECEVRHVSILMAQLIPLEN